VSVRISQREARQLRKQVRELSYIIERQKQRWSGKEFSPGFIAIAESRPNSDVRASIDTARSLKHAVVAVVDGEIVRYFADKL